MPMRKIQHVWIGSMQHQKVKKLLKTKLMEIANAWGVFSTSRFLLHLKQRKKLSQINAI
jgi:hypothetical protein